MIRLYVNSHIILILILTHLLLPTKLLGAPCCCHPHLSRTDLNTTYSRTDSNIISHISAIALSGAEVLCVLQSRGQAVCLIAGLQEKTTYRSAPFPSGGSRARDALQRKATEGATSEVARETAGWTRPDLTLETSISASIRPPLCGGGPPPLCGRGPPSLCGRGPFSLCGEDGRRSRRNSR